MTIDDTSFILVITEDFKSTPKSYKDGIKM